MPIAKTRKLIPCINPMISKNISLGSPDIISRPTVLKTKPIQIENMVFGISSPLRPTKVANARSINAKISWSPKSRAILASMGAKPVKSNMEMVPPMKEAIAAVINALSALPLRARGRPSKVVATAVEAPGIPSMIELIAPPYIAP